MAKGNIPEASSLGTLGVPLGQNAVRERAIAYQKKSVQPVHPAYPATLRWRQGATNSNKMEISGNLCANDT
jgi:hypothetical protein